MIRVCGREIKVEGRLIRVARIEGDKYIFPENPEELVEGLRECKTRIDLFTFMQGLPETAPKYSYPMELDNFATLPVSTFDHWWNKQIDNKTRNMARKAEKKGVVIREVPFSEALVHGIWEIDNETPIRQGRPYPHYGMKLERVREYAGTFSDLSVFIGAFFEDRLIGFVKLMMDENRKQMGLMHILSMVQHRDKAPTNGLLAQAVRSCAERGIPYLVYSNFAYGNKQQDSLSDFKENNGFSRIDLPRYYVPLTRLGWAAFRLGLHHRMAEYFPESIAAKLRGFRKAWYRRRYPLAKEA